jgi:hypothetical protein
VIGLFLHELRPHVHPLNLKEFKTYQFSGLLLPALLLNCGFNVISESSKALKGSKMLETEYTARLAVHFLSQLSLSKDYIMDNHSQKKSKYCPCPCKEKLVLGNTTIGMYLFAFAHPAKVKKSNTIVLYVH